MTDSAKCLYCDYEPANIVDAHLHICEQNTLTGKIDELRAQNTKLLAALEQVTTLARIKYGNLDADVDQSLTKTELLIVKAKEENELQ
jgi:hypothetical protein